jgi:flagellar L-ring protein precursor FlgH
MRQLNLVLLALLSFSLIGCAQVKRKVPMAACPIPDRVASFEDGAIYRAGTVRPLFEDRHARNVGDELTINVGEETTAPKPVAPVEKPAATPPKEAGAKQTAAKSKTKKVPSEPERPAVTSFSGKIIATVVVVLDNGNLLVCGDKLVKFANEDTNFTYVRFSGIINPQTISPNNSVQSSDVANVQLEHRNSNSIDPTPEPGFFNRLSSFFLPKKLYF